MSWKMWTVGIVLCCCESQLYLHAVKCAAVWIRILCIFHYITPWCLNPVTCVCFSLCLCYQLIVVISATVPNCRPGKQARGWNNYSFGIWFCFFEKLSLYQSSPYCWWHGRGSIVQDLYHSVWTDVNFFHHITTAFVFLLLV